MFLSKNVYHILLSCFTLVVKLFQQTQYDIDSKKFLGNENRKGIDKGMRILATKCIVRQGCLEDFRSICEVEVRCFKHPYPARLLFALIVLFPEYYFVAECGNTVVGYVIGFVERGGVGHVASIAVLPEYRGRGLGKRLLEAIEDAFRKNGLRESVLEVSVKNKVAINLYLSSGYRIAGRLENYYPDGSDAFVMRKNLSENTGKEKNK